MSDKPAKNGGHRALLERLDRLGAVRKPVRVADVKLMLAETRERPFSGDDWLFELKHDGYRLLAARENAVARLVYRRGGDASATYPELSRALLALPFESLVLDGELVVLDEAGRSIFQRLQQRSQLRRSIDVERASAATPATLFLFDLLALDGRDLRALPLVERKRALREVIPATGLLRYTDHVEDAGTDLYAEIERRGLEGMVAKKKASPYRAGRSADWQKIRTERTGDFAIVGFSAPKGARAGLGALHLAIREDGRLRYAGRVGTGFDDRLLETLRKRLEPKRRRVPACSGPVPTGAAHTWVEPELVCEVKYKEVTDDGSLRHPVFLRLREDKSVADGVDRGERAVKLSNLEKIFWPKEGYTKGDLIEYYREVSPWLMPYLRDRPLVLTRYPDGIEGKSFYQKDAPAHVPGWIRREKVWSGHAEREIDYFVCDDVESLLYIVNMGTIPLHLWSSRTTSLDRPDYCILDLDPKGAPFRDVVTVARAIHRLCESLDLEHYVKTSGATGLHVLIPLAGHFTYDQSQSFGELIARVINGELPEITTIIRKVSDRGGRVYLDYLQNRHGQTIAAPYSARPVPGATVSTPLEWREVDAKLDPKKFTLKTLPARLAKRKSDPVLDVLRVKPDLATALERLAAREQASST